MIPQQIYDHLIRPLLFQLDPETIHNLVMGGLRMLSDIPYRPKHNPKLERTVLV